MYFSSLSFHYVVLMLFKSLSLKRFGLGCFVVVVVVVLVFFFCPLVI